MSTPFGSFALTLTDPVGECHVTPAGDTRIDLFPTATTVLGVDLTATLEQLTLPEANACATCATGIGYVLTGPADEHIEWATAVITIDPDTKPRTLCENCA